MNQICLEISNFADIVDNCLETKTPIIYDLYMKTDKVSLSWTYKSKEVL